MSCYIATNPGSSRDIFPMTIAKFSELQSTAHTAVTAKLGGNLDLTPTVQQYIGAGLKTDGQPFYMSTFAPDLEPSLEHDWQGGFFAPFGVAAVHGSVHCKHGPDREVVVTVDATLISSANKEMAAAKWTILGSQHSYANKGALIASVEITNPGPHNPDDMRKCIALHAPQRHGEPRAIVAAQCAVAVAALIEAIC